MNVVQCNDFLYKHADVLVGGQSRHQTGWKEEMEENLKIYCESFKYFIFFLLNIIVSIAINELGMLDIVKLYCYILWNILNTSFR